MQGENQILTVPFHGICPANSNITLVSKRLSFPFATRRIVASFALNTNNLLSLQYFICGEDSAPTSGPPDGNNLFDLFGQVEYITGDDSDITLYHNYSTDTFPSFLKIYAVNDDAFDHTILSFIEFEVLPFKD